MTIPSNHILHSVHLTGYTPSCGATPVAAYIRVPFRASIRNVTGILGGAITVADGTITIAVNGTTVGTFTITQSGSAAGQLFSGATSTLANSQVSADDVISLTPSGASGASIPMHFSVVVRAN